MINTKIYAFKPLQLFKERYNQKVANLNDVLFKGKRKSFKTLTIQVKKTPEKVNKIINNICICAEGNKIKQVFDFFDKNDDG